MGQMTEVKISKKDQKYFYESTGSSLKITQMNLDGIDLELQNMSPMPMQKTISKSVSVKEIVTESIKKQYKFGKILGEGAFGKVKQATLLADPSKVFAIKSIPRGLIDKDYLTGES